MTSNRTTRWLLGASCMLLVLFLLLTAIAYRNCRAAEDDSALISLDAVPGASAAIAIRVAASNCARSLVQAVVTEDAAVRTASLAQARQAGAQFSTTLEQYRATMRINPDRDRALLDKLRQDFSGFEGRQARFEELVRTDDRAAVRAFFDRELVPTFVQLAESADTLVGYNQANAVQLAQTIAARSRDLRSVMLVALGMSLVCGVILAVNLSSLRHEQRAIRENEHRLREILDNLSPFVALCETDGRILELNESALKSAGVPREQMVGRRLQETPWRKNEELPEVQQRLQEAVALAADGTASHFDLMFRARDGEKITLDVRCDPVRDAQGRICHLLVSASDVTERERLKQQLLRSQRMEAIGTLSSGLAHDLNNILSPMLLAAGVLKMKLTAREDLNTVGMIETSVQRGAGIIRQLLAFGRGTEGGHRELPLRPLLKDLAQIVRETFPRNIEFEASAPNTLAHVTGDSTQLHQVLLNLCVNARDAMPGGGTLRVTARNVELEEANLPPHAPGPPGSYVELVVADTGAGMSRDILEKIFDPFFTTKPPGKGTGLGLASVQAIVKNHRGFLTVASTPWKGTTFTIFIPAAAAPAPAPAAAPPDELPRGAGETILLADDEPAIRETVGSILELHNYRVLTAKDGEEAGRVFLANRNAIKLVICDIQMPTVSGPELVRSLRLIEPELKFIVMTGSTHGGRRDELVRLGVTDIVDKPCPAARLLVVIRDRLAAMET